MALQACKSILCACGPRKVCSCNRLEQKLWLNRPCEAFRIRCNPTILFLAEANLAATSSSAIRKLQNKAKYLLARSV